MKRVIYQGGHAWEQANIPTSPRPDLPLLPDMTTTAPLRLAIDMPKSKGTRVSSLLTCRGHSLDLLAGFMTGI